MEKPEAHECFLFLFIERYNASLSASQLNNC